jgi:hypothetical protein
MRAYDQLQSFIIIERKFRAIDLWQPGTDGSMPFCEARKDYARSGDQNGLMNVFGLPL